MSANTGKKLRSQEWWSQPNLRELRAPRLAALRRFHVRRLREQAGHRHLQFLERAQQLQRAPAHGGRGRQARRVGRGRIPARVPHHLAGRNVHAAHHHALSQPDGDGRGGIHSRQSDGRRRAAVRLRQDHARATDGRGQRRHSGHRGAGRPDAERPVAGPAGSAPAPTAASCSICSAPAASPKRNGARSKAASRAAPATAR